MMEYSEKLVGSRYVHKGKIANLRIDDVLLPSGMEAIREIVEHAPAVAIVPVNDSGEIILVKQYRRPVDRIMLEIPAGMVEEGELGEETAQRELQEETGFKAGYIKHVMDMYSSPGFCDEKISIFFAGDLIPSSLEQDDDECVETETIPIADIPRMIESGAIEDAKTIAALSYYLVAAYRVIPK